MKDKLTILIPTNLVPSAPSTRVIGATLLSLSQIKEIYGCRCIIGFSFSSKEQGRSIGYINNLINIKSAFNTEVFPVIDGQQRENFLNIIKRVKTPYFLFWEHDWNLLETFSLKKVIKAMNKYKFINTIYFNKRPNIMKPYPCGDFILKPEPRVTEIPLLKTSKWSNNPNVTDIRVWKDWWYKEVISAPLDTSNPRKQIEPVLHYHYIHDIQTMGFDAAHAKWGMFSYGTMNNNRMVEHMDGSKRY